MFFFFQKRSFKTINFKVNIKFDHTTSITRPQALKVVVATEDLWSDGRVV